MPDYMCRVVTPLQLGEWQSVLSNYPDQKFAAFILRGIEYGFRIGFNPQLVTLQSARGNMSSAAEQVEVIDKYLREELAANRVVRIQDADAGLIHCSPFGVIPKRNRPNKWRLIVDLFSPEGHSVNDGISRDLSSLFYVSVDDVVAGIVQRGRGTLLAKMDIHQAYRNVPIHLSDRPFLGMQWQGATFVDAALPFGLRSAPLIFSAIADVLQWAMEKTGIEWVAHYIDDFITMGAPGSNECAMNSATMHAACDRMGLPVEPEKDEGPATSLPFLGIELDSVAMEIQLPLEKLAHLRQELTTWKSRKACKKRDLLSLIGLLSHACKVVCSGRSFLRKLINLSMVPKHNVRLNSEARSDIKWWSQFCQTWNGISMMHLPNMASPTAVLTSDASGNWGCGAYSGSNWFMLPWSGLNTNYHITVKELIPIAIAGAIWGPQSSPNATI